MLRQGASVDNAEHQNWLNNRGDAHPAGMRTADFAIGLIDADGADVDVRRDVGEVREELYAGAKDDREERGEEEEDYGCGWMGEEGRMDAGGLGVNEAHVGVDGGSAC